MYLNTSMEQMGELNPYEVESITSKRQSIGEILAAMQPETDDEVRRSGPPLDYSFKEIHKMSDVARAAPRDGPHAYVTITVALANQEPAPSTTPSAERPDPSKAAPEQQKPIKYRSKAIRLSNNALSSFDGFSIALQAVIDLPDTLEWIDLSFNDLPKISEALLEYKNLKVLYLHGNVIDDVHQIDKLAALPNLKTLTLHGNMLDNVKGYRQYVITTIPQLQYLDFSRITRADRDKAGTWVKLKIVGHHHKSKKKEIKE